MCILCDSDPINMFNGAHDAVGGLIGKAEAVPANTLDVNGDAEAVSVGGAVTGTLLSGGSEVFRLDLGAGERVSLDLGGIDLGTGAIDDTVLSVYDADGNLLAFDDDTGSGLDSFLTLTAETDGPIYVQVAGLGDLAGAGGFTLEVETADASGAARLDTMATYIEEGYWGTARKWNLSDNGAFAKDGQLTFNISGNGEDANGLTNARKELVREAFKVYEAVLGIDFVETNSNDADFRFSDNKGGAYAGSAYGVVGGQGYISYAIVNIDSGWYGSSSAYDGYTFQTALHEIGHALGLGHQGDYNGSANYGRDAEFANDSWQATMMSYFSQTQNPTIDASYAFLLSPMAVDWIALDNMYGEYGYSTANAFTGNTVWGFNTNISSSTSNPWSNLASYADHTSFTIVDGGGIDTVDFSGYGQDQRIDLTVTEGSFTQATTSDIGSEIGNMTLAVGTVIENAVGGSGNDQIIGNDVDNTLSGGAGDDTLTGGAGNDDLFGGADTDYATFLMDYAAYTFTSFTEYFEVLGEGLDRIFDDIEFLVFSDQTVAYQDLGGTGPAVAAPDAQDDALTVEAGAVLIADLFADNGNGVDLHADGLSFDLTAIGQDAPGAIHVIAAGTELTASADGTISFATNSAFLSLGAGQTANVMFEYTVTDSNGRTDTAEVTITISGVNDGPVAADDAFETAEAAALSGNVLSDNGAGADADPDTPDNLAIVALNGGALGTITLASGARVTLSDNGRFSYDQAGAFEALNAGQTETDSFTYTVSDGNGGTDTATVSVLVHGVDPIPAMIGTAGRDRLLGTDGADRIDGLDGRDTLTGEDGDDILDGGLSNDKLYGGNGHDIVSGGDGNDAAWAGSGHDEIWGGAGNDRLYGEAGNDALYGEAGKDRLDGGSGMDQLYGGADKDRLDGGTGNDALYGGDGKDVLFGKDGHDTLDGGAGDDQLRGGNHHDQLFGGEGNDRLMGENGDDNLVGAEGVDRLYGGNDDDRLDGGAEDDSLFGGNGDDALYGGDGDDLLRGGDGDDVISGGAGADNIRGDKGYDIVSYADAIRSVRVFLDGSEANDGGAAGDTLMHIEGIIGSAFADVLAGDENDNSLTGGEGADQFVFLTAGFGKDRITDFQDGADRLDFSAAGLAFEDFRVVSAGRNAKLIVDGDADAQVFLVGVLADQIDENDFV